MSSSSISHHCLQNCCPHLSDAYTVATSTFPHFEWGTPANAKQLDSRLPLLLYLKNHDRGTANTSVTAHDVINAAREWLAKSGYNDRVTFSAEVNAISQTLAKVVREVCMYVIWRVHCRFSSTAPTGRPSTGRPYCLCMCVPFALLRAVGKRHDLRTM